MKQTFKLELRRAFSTQGFYLALLIGMTIAIVQVVLRVVPESQKLDAALEVVKGSDSFCPDILYSTWIGGHFNCAEKQFYYLIFPILAALPFADSYFTDMQSGFIRSIGIRTKRRNYFVSKYLAVFLSGGTTVLFPLVFNFTLSCMFLPLIQVEATSRHLGVTPYITFAELILYNSLLHVTLYLFLTFIFGGLFACFALVAARYVGYRFLVLLAPFGLYLFINSLMALLQLKNWEPMYFLMPSYGEKVGIPMIVEGGLLFLTIGFFFFRNCGKRDVF